MAANPKLTRDRLNADINVTPFVDVMLVLLIIFMVAAPLPTRSIKVDLPPPKAPTEPTRPPLMINVQRGQVFIGDRPVALNRLAAEVRAELGPNQKDRITIRSDRHVAYKEFMAVVNELNGHGLTQLALVTEDF